MQVEAPVDGAALDEIERLCSVCGHAPVCAALRAIAPLMASWDVGEDAEAPPFEPEKLAQVCRHFFHHGIVAALVGAPQL